MIFDAVCSTIVGHRFGRFDCRLLTVLITDYLMLTDLAADYLMLALYWAHNLY